MSSLLQHHGGHKNGCVELLMYQVVKGPDWDKYCGPESYNPSPDSTTFCNDAEQVELIRPDGTKAIVPKLYRIYRKPKGMFGCWVVFRYNGKDQVPDLSVPIAVHKLPKDAEAVPEDYAVKYWFKN